MDTRDYSISELTTSGESPGWIFGHTAELLPDGVIRAHGGQLAELKGGKQQFRRNSEEFELDIKTGIWTQTTNRNWPQWSIAREDGGAFVLEHNVRVKDLIPPGEECVSAMEEFYNDTKFLLRGVPIRSIAGVRVVEIIAEGELPEEIRSWLPEVFRERVEALCKKKCVLT